MVMTQRTSPGLSALGLVLAAGVAAAGMFVTPSLACPEDDKKATKVTPPTAPMAIYATDAPPRVHSARGPFDTQDAVFTPGAALASSAVSPSPFAPSAPIGHVEVVPGVPTSFDMYMAGVNDSDDPEIAELLRRIERLERALKELRAEQGAKVTDLRIRARDVEARADVPRASNQARRSRATAEQRQANQSRAQYRELDAQADQVARDYEEARADAGRQRYDAERARADVAVERRQVREIERQVVAEHARVARSEQARERAVVAERRAVGERRATRSSPLAAPHSPEGPRLVWSQPGMTLESAPSVDAGNQTEVSYVLSSGKLEALTQLMIRPDVPIMVSPEDDRITVFGTPAQQKVFAAFIKMIDPDAKSQSPTREPPTRNAPSRDRSERGTDRANDRWYEAIDAPLAKSARAMDVRAQYATTLETARALKDEQAVLALYAETLNADTKKHKAMQHALLEQAESLYKDAEMHKARSSKAAPEAAARFMAEYTDFMELAKYKEIEAKAAHQEIDSAKSQIVELRLHMAELEARASDMAARAKAIEKEIQKLEKSKD